MNQSQSSQSSYRQDYVLTSYQNEYSSNKHYLTPISPNMYLKNIGHNYLNVQNIYSCSPKQQIQMHKITPHPIFQLRESFDKNKHENFDLKNKQNFQSNSCVFDPAQYEKLFEKKINFNNVGMGSSKNSSPSIGQLSNQSKKFIQQSIQKSIDTKKSQKSNKLIKGSNKIVFQTISDLSQSQNELKKLFEQQNQQIKPRQTAQSYQTFEKGLILEVQYPSSSRNQSNIYSTIHINQKSQKSKKQLQQQIDKKKQLDSISSFKQNQQIIDYFLTQEDDPNNSAEGIQLLSQLKSQLNSLINGSGSGSNSDIYSNQRSKHARTYNQIKFQKIKPNNVKVGFKRSSNACQQLAVKLQELKLNIFALHSKMNASSRQNQPFVITELSTNKNNASNENKTIKQKQIEKQPEIYFKTDNKTNSKKLIYPDSRIIFSRNDEQFVQFDSQFSKIMNDSSNQLYQNHHTTSKYLQDQVCQKSSFNKFEKSSQKKSQKMRDSYEKSEFENNSNNEYMEEQKSKFQSSQKERKSAIKLTIQKQAFKLFYPNFYDLNNEREKNYNEGEQQRQSQNLQKSCISSTSNEKFMKEMNNNFNSKLNKLDTLFQFDY